MKLKDTNKPAFAPDRRSFLKSVTAIAGGAAAASLLPSGVIARTSDEVVLAIPTLAGNFEPAVWHGFGDSVHAIDCIARGLTHIDFHSNDPQPAIAESWTISDDGRVYDFKIREGLTFHDDSPVTAKDCMRTFHRLIDKSDPSYPEGNTAIDNMGGSNVAGFEQPDDMTFRIKLEEPDAALLARLTRPDMVILSSKALDEYKADIGPNLVGCGPYKLSEVVPNERVVLEAFGNFYGGTPAVPRLVLQVLPDALALTTAMASGKVNLTNMIPHSNISRLERKDGINVIVPKAFISLFIGMNAKAGALTDLRVRQAINYALDRKAIIREAFFGRAEEPAYLSPRAMNAFSEDQMVYSTQDMDKARKLLTDAGAQGASVGLIGENSLFWPKVGQVVERNLKELGLQPKVEYVDSGTFNGRMFDPEKHEMGLWQRSAFMPDLDDKYSPLLSSESFVAKNATCHTELDTQPELDRMLEAGIREQDPEKRNQIYVDLNAFLAEKVMVYTMMADIYLPVVSTGEVEGVNADAFGTYRTFPESLRTT